MPSPADEVAQLFMRTAHDEEEDERASVVAFTVRVPAARLAHITAMALHADVSRNEMTNELLRVGISSVLASLPDEIRDELHEDIADRISNL